MHLDHWFEDEDYQYIFMEYCSKGVSITLMLEFGEQNSGDQHHVGKRDQAIRGTNCAGDCLLS